MRRYLLILAIFISIVFMNSYANMESLSQGTLYLIAPTDFISSKANDWKALERIIKNASSKEIVIYWQGNGGYVYQGHEFINVVEEAKAQGKHILFIVTGPAWSMHANVMCLNNVRFNKDGYLVFHNVRTSFLGHAAYNDTLTKDELKPCGKYITQSDIETIIQQRKGIVVYPDGHKEIIND